MLVPRPETRTPTFIRSAIMGCGPIPPSRPGAARSRDRTGALSGFDPTEVQNSFTNTSKRLPDVIQIVLRDDHGHADAAVEGPRHLPGLDIALRLEEGHQPRLLPGRQADDIWTR